MLSKLRKQEGFTIIELLIVIAIIGILATLVLTNFSSAQAKGRDSVRQNDIGALSRALELYHTENAAYPGDVDTALAGLVEGVNADTITDEAGQLIDVLVTDQGAPQGNPYTDLTVKPNPADGESQYTYDGYNCTATAAGTGVTCASFVIYSWTETESAVYSEASLN